MACVSSGPRSCMSGDKHTILCVVMKAARDRLETFRKASKILAWRPSEHASTCVEEHEKCYKELRVILKSLPRREEVEGNG